MTALKQLPRFFLLNHVQCISFFAHFQQRCLNVGSLNCKHNKTQFPSHRKFKFERPKISYNLPPKKVADIPQKMLNKILQMPDSEYLHGRSVCEIVLNSSRRSVFKLYLSSKWQLNFPTDVRVENILKLAKNRGITIEYVDNLTLEHLSDGRWHQGVCLEVGQLTLPVIDTQNIETLNMECCADTKNPLWVFLFNVGDPGNVGAILRSCQFLGIDKVFMTKRCAPLSSATSKRSSGAAEVVDCYTVKFPSEFLKQLLTTGWDIIGTDIAEDDEINTEEDIYPDMLLEDHLITNSNNNVIDINNVVLEKPSVILFGSEGFGIPTEISKLFTKTVTIMSMQGKETTKHAVPCLNVSSSAAIILHHLVKTA